LSNIFDRANYPEKEPNELVVGDYWAWKKEDLTSDYPTGTYSLSYEFHCDSGGGGSHQFTINATEADDIYYIEVPSSTSDNYNPHDYIWASYITRTADSSRTQIGEGKMTILPNLADTNADLRSHAKIVLDSLEAVIQGRANMDQSSMSIAGRSLSRMSIYELMTFRDRYKAEYLQEVKLSRIRNGNASGNTIKVQF
jgi:hypothetical protein